MEMLEYLEVILQWQAIIKETQGVVRECEQDVMDTIGSKPIKIITGFRRSGKSFLMQRIAANCIKEKIYPVENIFYLNFEEYKLSSIDRPEKVDALLQVFKTEISKSGKKLLILDEIQKVHQWDQLIRTIYERERDVDIFITGSNSDLLSSELGSNLAGRFISFFILPFSFKEVLRYKGYNIKRPIDFIKQKQEIILLFHDYVRFGGLPETYTIKSDKAKYSYLEGILSKVILDDILGRFNVRQTDIIKHLLSYLLSGTGNIVSNKRIVNFIKHEKGDVKQQTIKIYIDYILQTFALFGINKFDWKQSQFFSGKKKYYAVDTGISNLYGDYLRNYSRRLENIIFLKLMREGCDIFYGILQNGKEIDFISKKNNNYVKYQVTKTLHTDNYTRELSPFTFSDQYSGDNVLLTMDETEKKLTFKESKIIKRSIIKWLLDI
ncbi:MAG: ATP-binding protein [Candidatus Magnetomorum sp.]|nr:ATP-binding protein [Candidatus Magnetomorum sp.]